LAAAVMQSGDFGEMVIWAAVALVVQLACFAAMRLLRRDVSGAIAAGNMAEATLLAFASVALGVLNAACLS
jgi:putative membrane protein